MDLEQGLTVELSAIPGLESKVYPITAAQDTPTPYATYALGSSERTSDLTGRTALIKQQYQIDVYESTYAGLKNLKKPIIQKLKSLNLRSIGDTGPLIQQAEITNDYETYEIEAKLYRAILEVDLYTTE
ncbi:DUF3168 domain-containing protein [Desulfosporosinus sp. Sb-LF]|uniref:DUF3168 domain-containing protein n=1 Tax=Desulfosporosinus sp. Sb-LF TaxID=2560027 RepID=UPI00107F968F|nr:DUF3168 domain-containing protein [Desulfosporosinus sp. Sb-LF]TGE31328.1 DUF3168 domain-containing protein [Desulfosporosinus sp. Sb-LF]